MTDQPTRAMSPTPIHKQIQSLLEQHAKATGCMVQHIHVDWIDIRTVTGECCSKVKDVQVEYS